MSISSLTGSMPSLADYLSKNGSSGSSTGITAYKGGSTIDLSSLLNSGSGDGDVVSLSATAQLMLAQGITSNGSGVTGDADGGKAAKAGAQDFFKKFFISQGVDGEKLSDEAKSLIKGISDLVDNMGPVSRDTTIDGMTQRYVKGQRTSYTLQGTNERLSLTIQYKDGKPTSMTVMQLQGGTANNAVISLGQDAKGALSTVDVSRVQKQFSAYGNLTSTTQGTSLSLDLYAKAANSTTT